MAWYVDWPGHTSGFPPAGTTVTLAGSQDASTIAGPYPSRQAAAAWAAGQGYKVAGGRGGGGGGKPPKGGTILGATIAADALRYDGATYVYGGNASRVGLWDCSSFVSYVLGHDLRLALPGGRWGGPGMPPATHGPVVLSYAAWAGSYQVSVPGPGDLCIWAGDGPNGHIGIALGSDRMISALNPQLGTAITQIAGTGPSSAPLTYRRLTGAVTTGGPVGYGTGSAPPYLAMAAVAAVAVLLFLAAGAALTWGVAAGARKLRQQPAS